MKFVDLIEMGTDVTNGARSVSEGKVFWNPYENPYGTTDRATCVVHGAMLCVSQDGRIWRCPACNEGGYLK